MEIPERVRQAFPALAGRLALRTLSGGLLHRSLHVRAQSGEYVLQRVSDVFAPEIHDNIAAVTHHLKERGFATLELLPTRDGALWIDLPSQGRWRLLTHLAGESFERIESELQARSAGALVGRFHAALDDFDAPLAPMGIPLRNTPRYIDRLRRALEEHTDHRLASEVRAIAAWIEERLARLGPPPLVPDRVIHGDLKLANLLFEGTHPPERDRAIALVDFDTLMWAPLWGEWGDAWRSWCHRRKPDGRGAHFDLEIFAASLAGFVQGYARPLSRAEADSLVLAAERVSLELCVRFATDMLEESYFAWDEARFETAAEHNAFRVREQQGFFDAAANCRGVRAEIVEGATR